MYAPPCRLSSPPPSAQNFLSSLSTFQAPVYRPNKSLPALRTMVELDGSLLLLTWAETAPFLLSCGVDQYADGKESFGFESYGYNPSAKWIWK